MKKFILLCLWSIGASAVGANVETSKTFRTFDGHEIRGSLTYPSRMNGRRPAVLLIHGAGPMDLNLTIPGRYSADGRPNRAFESISKALGENGVIVFRYNKRGITDVPGAEPVVNEAIYNGHTFDQLVADARAALEILRNDPNVDTSKILLLGISQGTMIAPQVAKEDGHIAGLLLLASIGNFQRNFEKIAELGLKTLLLHGEIDVITPLEEANVIADALRARNVPYKLITYPGLGHGFSPNVNGLPTLGPVAPAMVRQIPQWILQNY